MYFSAALFMSQAPRECGASFFSLSICAVQSEALRRQLAEVQHSLEHWKEEAEARQAALEEFQQQQRQQQRGQLQASFAVRGQFSRHGINVQELAEADCCALCLV